MESSSISLDIWYRCEIICDKDRIKILLYKDKEKIFGGHWDIPKGDVVIEYKHSSEYPTNHMPIPITFEYVDTGCGCQVSNKRRFDTGWRFRAAYSHQARSLN